MNTQESVINYFSEDRPIPKITSNTTDWLIKIADSHQFKISDLNYIFCSDEYLLKVNKQYLAHDYYTDIITFDNSDEENVIEGDIFISIDRVIDNEQKLDVPRGTEILRVMSHGLLHLCGFKDKSEQEAKEMRKEENISISKWQHS